MSTNKSAKLSNKLGLHLEDAVDVKTELDTTSSSSKAINTEAILSKKLGLHLEDAVDVFELLKKVLDTTMFELNAQRADLKARALELQAGREEFKAKQQEWEATSQVSERELKAAKAKLEEDMLQLEAEKTQLRVAQIQLKAAQSQLEDATQHEAATSAIATAGMQMSMSLEEDNIKPRIQVDQLRSEILTVQKTNEAEMKKSKLVENERLATDNSKLKNEKLIVEDELKSPQDQNKIVEADPGIEKSENPKVFFDMTICGVFAGRITFELFADILPDYVELFRAFCTGEKGVSQKGKPLHYKGMSMRYCRPNYILGGNLGTMTHSEAQSIYGDLKPVCKEFIKESCTIGNLFMYHGPSLCREFSVGIFISTDQNKRGTVGSFVVIGKVIQGIEVLHDIKKAFSNQLSGGLGMYGVVIADSGEVLS